jgi:hypothetical protein
MTAIVNAPRRIDDMLASCDWQLVSRDTTKAHGFHPNKIYQNRSLKAAAIVVRISSGGGFSLCEPALRYYADAVRSKRLSQAHVVMVDRTNYFIKAETILNVESNLDGVKAMPSNNPEWPPYFWLDGDFKLSTTETWRNRDELL